MNNVSIRHSILMRESAFHCSQSAITIHVFLYDRINSTKRLLSQLVSANYSSYSHDIPLILHLDRPSGGEDQSSTTWLVNAEIENMLDQYKWPHGPKYVDAKDLHTGLESSWMTAWTTPYKDNIMVALEDDIEVSPLYFQWLLKVLDEYALWKDSPRDPRLLGLCMTPIRSDEVSKNKTEEKRKWSPSKNVPTENNVYLHGIPCSWGAVYFGDRWNEFQSFYRLRKFLLFNASRPEDPQILVPNSLTNYWRQSWKRFMFEFIYGRGGYLIYPNLKNNCGLARTLNLPGVHYTSQNAPPRDTICLADNMSELHLDNPWPSYYSLPLFDIYCEPVDRMKYAKQGISFLNSVKRQGLQFKTLVEKWKLVWN